MNHREHLRPNQKSNLAKDADNEDTIANFDFLSAIERSVKIIKEVGILALAAYLIFTLAPIVPKWAKNLADMSVTEVNVMGISAKLTETRDELAAVIKNAPPEKSTADSAVTPDRKMVFDAIQSIDSLIAQASTTKSAAQAAKPDNPTVKPPVIPATTRFWVFLGPTNGQSLPAKNFKTNKVPEIGQTIEAATEVYKRSSAPFKNNQDWILGDQTGVLKTGQRVVIRRLENIDSAQAGFKNLWAEVELVN
ncbi:hypothetical protein [Undibacterium sp. TS12]|uniref:hypothetical protein n=1 Tax=Undibacterium sp. TS12 TaxID=2908202 RepID=UPI001F4CC9AE|nr:hypothetical protein [Undibacterium sp. TS12]MCH8620417.1 hypothetical protein [Undibacterium sp. TS12]